MSSHDPLYDPKSDVHALVPPLREAIDRAQKILDEKSQANIHDRDEMIRAAYGLHHVLHDLLAALDQAGEQK